MKEEKIKYPVLSIRTEQEIKDWFMSESLNYKSWNLFLRELKIRYNKPYDKN